MSTPSSGSSSSSMHPPAGAAALPNTFTVNLIQKKEEEKPGLIKKFATAFFKAYVGPASTGWTLAKERSFEAAFKFVYSFYLAAPSHVVVALAIQSLFGKGYIEATTDLANLTVDWVVVPVGASGFAFFKQIGKRLSEQEVLGNFSNSNAAPDTASTNSNSPASTTPSSAPKTYLADPIEMLKPTVEQISITVQKSYNNVSTYVVPTIVTVVALATLKVAYDHRAALKKMANEGYSIGAEWYRSTADFVQAQSAKAHEKWDNWRASSTEEQPEPQLEAQS